MKKVTFKKGVLASSIAMVLAGGAAPLAMAEQGVEKEVEVIEVTGIRGSTKASINGKRFADSQVDGIAAEDIGKLPDVTITDSLQRITGVQIERVAGEGGAVQIRGLPQIDTTMNGETFLSATTIDSSGADLGDLPAQLFGGVDVYKSATARNTAQGIAGAIDLKTRRPFDMDEGWTFVAGAEATRGSITEETDPTFHGLASYNDGKIGFLISAVTQEATLATDYNGHNDTSENGGIGWTNNNYAWSTPTEGAEYRNIVPHGFTAFSKTEERERDAIQASLQVDLGEGFTVTADYFYTNQDRFNARSGLNNNSRWQAFSGYGFATNYTGDSFTDGDGNEWRGVDAFKMRPHRLQSFTQVNVNEEKSRNFNLQLDYDNGGALTGQVRFTDAHATAKMRHAYGEGDIMSIDQGATILGPGGLTSSEYCTNGEEIIGASGGCMGTFSTGIQTGDFFLTHDASGEYPTFGGFDQVVSGGKGPMSVADYMADLDSYHIGAFSSEGNTDDTGDLRTFSTKWNYALDDNDVITSIDFGIRYSQREVDHDQFTYTSEFGNGCDIAQWKAVDQQYSGDVDAVTGGESTNPCYGLAGTGEFLTEDAVDANGDPVMRPGDADGDGVVSDGEVVQRTAGEWMPYTLLPPTRLDQHTTVSWQTDFGNVKGIPGIWVIDPSNFRDPRQWHKDTFGNVQRTENGGNTYDVGLDELTYFIQANFEYEKLSGNVGLKVIETTLFVKQNLIGPNLPHSGLGPDIGDVVSERTYKDELPSINLAYQATDDVVLRAAFSENMQALNLDQWGAGKNVGMTFDNSCNCMRVQNVTLNGNPDLNPWRSENWSLSAEWYAGDASMFFASAFGIDIAEFTESKTEDRSVEPDGDGIIRGPHPTTFTTQSEGGEVAGFEIGAKVALSDFLGEDGIFKNVGFDVNYTFTDSKQEAKDVYGDDLPFQGMSEDTYNAVVWYENDTFSARLAWNSRSPRLITAGNAGTGGQSLYQDDYSQVDFNATYNFSEDISFYVNGSNITEEYQQAYIEFEKQKAFQNVYEARWTVGTRVKF
ncbi:TonB-dependent receptor [Thalassotalea sp. 1_MG-2023]|uniref:TonB-dependent receptor n=1 Tax=Thalassotalea sp. 1_MG-2023 TaxID=3062680 RepID=UPI0026E383DD|nr:TonB-dependent receptor [Thalassotalea sp. 1_MG-2023]MDO6428540.1 TonB-dependent receptor [Thalassotalea sp. 1_MG-2023]